MIDERLYADLVDLYESNVKAFQEQNSGLLINDIMKLEIEDLEEFFDQRNTLIDHRYIKEHYIGFTINPQIIEMDIKNNISSVSISPDISFERQLHTD